jgi:hypothetical protein
MVLLPRSPPRSLPAYRDEAEVVTQNITNVSTTPAGNSPGMSIGKWFAMPPPTRGRSVRVPQRVPDHVPGFVPAVVLTFDVIVCVSPRDRPSSRAA